MEVVILCGGKGVRLHPVSEEIPKPMVEIGDEPILEHIMKIYNYYGYNEFTLLMGYKGGQIMDYFSEKYPDWNIDFLFTGIETETAERIYKIKDKVDETFFLTYGDGVADINIKKELIFHKKMKKVGTMTIVPLRTEYGIVEFDENLIASNYLEKPIISDFWINGGFFIFEPELFDHWEKNTKDFSRSIIPKLCRNGLIACYKHEGFWMGMDTYRDNIILNKLLEEGNALWMVWKKERS